MPTFFRFSSLFLLCCFSQISLGQSASQWVVAASGGHSSQQDIQVSSTIGQVVSSLENTSENSLIEGFHQVDQVITLLSADPIANQKIKVFPNPTVDKVAISLQDRSIGDYQLINLNGQILSEKSQVDFSQQQEIPMDHLSEGIYLLTIQTKDQIKRVKIVKQ